MSTPILIIISGPPCSGKTTLGRWLAARLQLPIMHRDIFKEALFDSMGWNDLSWSQLLGGASYAILYETAAAVLAANYSLIIESNFDPVRDVPRLHALAARAPFLPLQIRCMAEGRVLFQRFLQRANSGARHPGHLDQLNIAVYEPIVQAGAGARNDFLDIGGERMDVDTNDLDALDYEQVLTSIHAAIARLTTQSRPMGA